MNSGARRWSAGPGTPRRSIRVRCAAIEEGSTLSSSPKARSVRCLRIAAWLLVVAGASAAQPRAPSRGKLSRLETLQLGVERNLDLLVKRLEAKRLGVLEQAAWQPYTPSLLFDADYQTYGRTTDSYDRDRLLAYQAGIGWKAPVGTTVSATAQMNQSLAGSPAPGHDSVLALTLSQPLLKDAWSAGAALPLAEARLQAAIQRELFEDDLNSFLMDLATAYWDLAVAQADLAIKTRSRDRAQRQYDDTAENIRRGILANVEIYVVQDNVVFFEQELLRTEETLLLARRKLAELLQLDADSPLEADDKLEKPELKLPARAAAVDEGLLASPKLREQRWRVELAAARLSHASNQALPSLNANASVGLTSGKTTSLFATWGQAVSPLTPDARVGLSLAVPLGWGPVNAAVESARLDAERQQAELASRELKVRFEIDNGLTDLEANVKLLALGQKQVEVAELKLGAETEKYKNGISTLADVVRFQRDLDNALIGFKRGIRTLHVAHAKLLASQGTLRQTVGVEAR